MWTVIIIIAVCFIGKFVLDSINQSNDIKSQGGVRTKYAHLIQSLLDSDPRARILQETNTFVNVGISGPAGAQSFFLQQTFGKLSVQIVIKNNPLLGNMTIERTFPEDMDQDEMMKQLMIAQKTEMEKKINRYQ